jgi:hypothetical protein
MAAFPYLAAAYLQRKNRKASSRLYAALPVGMIFAALGIIGLVWVHRVSAKNRHGLFLAEKNVQSLFD